MGVRRHTHIEHPLWDILKRILLRLVLFHLDVVRRGLGLALALGRGRGDVGRARRGPLAFIVGRRLGRGDGRIG